MAVMKTGRAAALALFGLSATSAHAHLLGVDVTGTLNIDSSPLNYFSPAAVTVADPAVEFGFQDADHNAVVNFTDTQLIIAYESIGTAIDWSMTFAGSPGLFQSLSHESYSYSGISGLTSFDFALLGDAITIRFVATGSPQVPFRFNGVFNVGTTANVPEPGTLALLGVGLLGLGVFRRRG